MARKSKGKFNMKGPSVPGIKGFKGTSLEDGRAASSAFQMKGSPLHEELESGLDWTKKEKSKDKDKYLSRSKLAGESNASYAIRQAMRLFQEARDRRRKKKEKEDKPSKSHEETTTKYDEDKVTKEEQKLQEMENEAKASQESVDTAEKSRLQEEQQKKLASHMKPVELGMMDLPEEKAESQTFDEAFAAARKAGEETFEWTNPETGKIGTYGTELAGTTTSTPSTVEEETVKEETVEEQKPEVSGPHEDDKGKYYLVEGKKKYYSYS